MSTKQIQLQKPPLDWVPDEIFPLVKEARRDFGKQIEMLFIPLHESPKNEIDIPSKTAKLRVATLVYCRDINEKDNPIYPNMRLGILADRGLRQKVEHRLEVFGDELKIRPPERVYEKTVHVNGWKVTIYGRADLEYHLNGHVIPIEFKASNNEATINRGRLQSAIYAWLYDAPFSILLYGPSLRFEIIGPVSEKMLKERIWYVLKHIVAGDQQFPCPEVKVPVYAAPPVVAGNNEKSAQVN